MNKKINTCGDSMHASCVNTEVTPNSQSVIVDESCLNAEQVLQDIYTQIDDLLKNIDLSGLGEDCLEYTLVDGKLLVKNAILKIEERFCELQERIVALESRQLCDFPLSGCGLEIGDLVDSCGDQPQTLSDLLQILINNDITP